MNKTLRRISFLVAAIAMALVSFGCSKSTDTASAEPIKIAYPNWAEGVAMSYLVADIAQNDLGLKVEMTMADPGLIYASLAEGTEDLLMDSWLPVTHASYMKQYGDRLEEVGTTFTAARIGLVVPDYVTTSSIAELNEHAADFNGQIIGIGQGAGIMKQTTVALKDYNMDKIELIPSSGPAMTTALKEAISKKKPIVITGWQPHWMFARFNLKFLDDPKGVYGADEQIKTIARKGFSKDHPKLAAMLSRFKMDVATLGGLMDAMSEASSDADKLAAAHKWAEAHKALVQSWLGK